MSGCAHNVDMGFDYPCVECEISTPEQAARGDKLRSVQLNPRTCGPTSFNNVAPARNVTANNWEKGIATDHRGVPYLDQNANPIPVKKFAENRSRYERTIRKHRNAGVH